MFTLTLELNNQCNLNCAYCYLGPKINMSMEWRTAKAAVHYAINVVRSNHKDKMLKINFLGGEPLISFELMQKIVSECEKFKGEIFFSYTITTNGLLLNNEILDFLIVKKVKMKLSLDGDKKVNDLNRFDCQGKGSYDEVLKKIDLLRRYENLSQNYIQISNVITGNNYKYLTSSLQHILTRGFRYVDSGLDSTEDWNDGELDLIGNEIIRALDYFIDFNLNTDRCVWSFLNKIVNSTQHVEKKYSCGAGIVSFYISPEGKTYPCPAAIGTEIYLGNINEILDFSIIKEFVNATEKEDGECSNCKLYNHCKGRSCFVVNQKNSGDIFKVPKFDCWFTKFSHKVVNQYEKILIENDYFRVIGS